MSNYKYAVVLAIIALISANSCSAMLKRVYPTFNKLIELKTFTNKPVDEETLKLFYRGRFEEIVAQDIQAKQPYTRHLGLKITPHGDLSMKRLPTTDAEGEKIAVLLAQLYTTPKSSSALKAVQEFYATKTNPSPMKNADAFFPEIIVKSKSEAREHWKKLNNTTMVPPNLYCFFDASIMKIIVIREHFTLEKCHAMLHEFTHYRQYLFGLESGAGYYRTLKKLTLPLAIAIELEAEFEAINGHPDKKYLLKQCAQKFSPATYQDKNSIIKEIQERFPYFTEPFAYSYILNRLNLENSDPNPTLTDTAKKAQELFYMMVGLVIKKQKLVIEQEKNGTNIFGMGGTDYPAEVFKLKKKLKLLPE